MPLSAPRLNIANGRSHARLNQAQQEFAPSTMILLKRALAAASGGVPIGNMPRLGLARGLGFRGRTFGPNMRVCWIAYSALSFFERIRDACALSREIRSQIRDPGLYERLAGFLEQKQNGRRSEVVYHRAMAQFSES